MTTFYTTQSLQELQSGTRVMPGYKGLPSDVFLGSQVPSKDNLFDPKGGRTIPLLVGTRTRSIASYGAITYQGVSVDINIVDLDRTYAMIEEVGVGQRTTWFAEGDMTPVPVVKGERVPPILVGASAFGIHYTPIIVAQEEKRIRRWPRDWHGENMN